MRKNLGRLVGRSAVVVGMVGLGGGGGWLYTTLTPPAYTASTVVIATEQQPIGDRRDVSFAQAYGRLVGQLGIAGVAGQAAQLPADEVRRSVQARTSPDSPMIEITGSADGAAKAATLVNAVADTVVQVAGSRLADTGVRLLVLSAAVAPPSPSSPNLKVDVATGAAAGFLLGGLAVLGWSGRRRDEHDLQPDAPADPAEGDQGADDQGAADQGAADQGADGSPPVSAPEVRLPRTVAERVAQAGWTVTTSDDGAATGTTTPRVTGRGS